MELAWVNRGRRKLGKILEIEISGRSVDCFLFLSEKMGKERGNIFRQMSQLERIIVACRVIEIRKNISIISCRLKIYFRTNSPRRITALENTSTLPLLTIRDL